MSLTASYSSFKLRVCQ